MNPDAAQPPFFLKFPGRNKLLFIFSLVLASCAQIVPPSGGKIDDIPPHAKKYLPDSAATHFKSSKIEILFDEYIQLKDLNNQLIISPPLEKSPDVKVKNKTLYLEFRGPLKDSTTYTLNFGTAIADIHEGKAADNFRYVFSTGSYIDSLTLSGTVSNAFTHLPEKGVLINLYKDLSDSTPYKNLPSYFSKTDASGKYKIQNIKPGKYKIFGLRDANSNYRYNEGEAIAFRKDTLNLVKNDTANLSLFQEVPRKVKLKEAHQADYGKIIMVFNKAPDSLKIQPLNYQFAKGDEIIEKSKGKDTVIYWFVRATVDTLKLLVSDNGRILDTLHYKLITREKMISKNKGVKPSLQIKLSANPSRILDLGSPLYLEFSTPPVSRAKDFYSKFILREDSGKTNLFQKGRLALADSPHRPRLESWTDTSKCIRESAKYKVLILPGAFTDLFGFTNDTLKTNFSTQEMRYYGTMRMRLHLPSGNYIFQLLDEKDALIHEKRVSGTTEVYYEFLPPAKYHTRLIVDENNNGKWDTGNYLEKKQPERVIYNMEPILIRSNWDPDFDWYVK